MDRRLFLGIDASCITCSSLAKRIEEETGGKVEVRSLRDPQVEEWRRIAFGEDAPWTPTLFDTRGFGVLAWTGWQMGVQLGRLLGPVATWRVMQALGEIGATPKIEESPIVEKLPEKAAAMVVGMSRGQFLKGVGGAAVAMSVLSGVGPFAGRAEALEDWQFPQFTGFTQLRGTQLKNYCNRIAQRASCEWTAGAGYAPAMQSGLAVSDENDAVAQGSGVKARAGIHTMASGNEMYACTFDLQGEKVLSFYEYETKFRDRKWEVKRWGVEDGTFDAWAERLDINGVRLTAPGAPTLQAASDCPDTCGPYSGTRPATTCISYDWACIRNLAGNCMVAAGTCGLALRAPSQPAVVACLGGALLCGNALNPCCQVNCSYCHRCGVT